MLSESSYDVMFYGSGCYSDFPRWMLRCFDAVGLSRMDHIYDALFVLELDGCNIL